MILYVVNVAVPTISIPILSHSSIIWVNFCTLHPRKPLTSLYTPMIKDTESRLQFDVIVVYNDLAATSPSDASYAGRTPFAKTGENFTYNKSYKYFLQYCKRQGLRAAFATTQDITGSGLFSAVWIFDKQWKRKKELAQTHLIFDKFSGFAIANVKKYALLMKHPKDIQLFHNEKVREIFGDKLYTFELFPEYAIPTVAIDLSSATRIDAAKKNLGAQLRRHSYPDDFIPNAYVLKDRNGAGGVNIFKVRPKTNLLKIGAKYPKVQFILQPFIQASGFRFGEHVRSIDLRVIICNGVSVQSYIRIAKKGEFRANAKQGGQVEYLTPKQIPKDVARMVRKINSKLPAQNSFYALDFIKSDAGHLYFIEGNATPGLNWYDDEDERRAKQLMRLIIQQLKTMMPIA